MIPFLIKAPRQILDEEVTVRLSSCSDTIILQTPPVPPRSGHASSGTHSHRNHCNLWPILKKSESQLRKLDLLTLLAEIPRIKPLIVWTLKGIMTHCSLIFPDSFFFFFFPFPQARPTAILTMSEFSCWIPSTRTQWRSGTSCQSCRRARRPQVNAALALASSTQVKWQESLGNCQLFQTAPLCCLIHWNIKINNLSLVSCLDTRTHEITSFLPPAGFSATLAPSLSCLRFCRFTLSAFSSQCWTKIQHTRTDYLDILVFIIFNSKTGRKVFIIKVYKP